MSEGVSMGGRDWVGMVQRNEGSILVTVVRKGLKGGYKGELRGKRRRFIRRERFILDFVVLAQHYFQRQIW